ncbi:MAG: hypothetical protein M1812_007104 [Candelaria pacifica]|nr:MAG: hypothetical protein M1812_007104 [Candelaria pacifica]
MAQAGAVAPIPVNGTITSQLEAHQVAEYEKILKLRDEIFTGKHPRLKVPSHAITKATARPVESPPATAPGKTENSTSNVLSNGVSPHTKDITPVISHPTPQKVPQPSSFLHKSPSTQRHPAVAPSSSGIDPIFLTKSDDLVRAEIQLQRQRLERALKESVDRLHKTEARGRSDQDPIPDFNVSEVLDKALQLFPPSVGLEANGTNGLSTATDSFDENSFYSSQVNDSPVNDPNDLQEVSEPYPMGDEVLDTEMGYNNGSPTLLGPRVDLGDLRVSNPLDNSNTRSYASIQYGSPSTHKPGMPEANAGNRIAREESEYFPPEAHFYDSRNDVHGEGSKAQSNEHRPPLNLQAGDSRARPSQSSANQFSPSSPELRIVKNHIASPVAPQPSRVSPLAVAKLPPFARERRDAEEPPAASEPEVQAMSARQSPEEVPQPSGHRKRLKKGDGFDRPRKQRRGNRGKVADSPEPYIKEEPESPPQLNTQPRLRQSERPKYHREPIGVDDTSPRRYRSDTGLLRDYEDRPISYRYEIETPNSAATQQTSSRVDRREPDLRRVASLQYTRRPVSPPQYSADFFPSDARASRALSHTYNERPMIEHAQYYREPLRSHIGHYVRSEQSRSPPPVRPPVRERLTPAPMGPPPRKIVVDQYGNRYYAAPPTIDLTSSVPPPSFDENINPRYAPVHVRDHVRRAPVAPVDLYDEEAFEGRMPPPAARRVVERTDADVVDHRSYRQREYEPRPVEATMPQEDRPQIRQLRDGSYVSHIEPMPLPPREYVPRMHSVRPDSSRYEAPREYVPRLQSVRPELNYDLGAPTRTEDPPRARRELTLRPEDGLRVREYLPVENERFTYAPRPQSRDYPGPALAEWPRDRIQEIHEAEPRRASYRY